MGLPLEDLVQEGYIGLIKAVENSAQIKENSAVTPEYG